ncbi:MAG: VOC family protein [Planctomycetota bacterium]
MIRRIDHVEIVPADFERSLSFYADVLGFSLKERIEVEAPPIREIAYLTLGDTMLELLSVSNPASPSGGDWRVGYRMMALEVDDLEETRRELDGRGAEITWGPVELEDSVRAEIRDPDGLPVELREWK